MKLLTRTNIYFIAITLIVFTLGGKVFYDQIRIINKDDAVERLDDEKVKVLNFVKLNNALPQNAIWLGDSLAFLPTASGAEGDKLDHLKLLNKVENEYEPYMSLTFTVNSNNQYYRATLYRPLLESDDIATGIRNAMLIIGGCLFAVLLLSNVVISKIIWRPFYKTLEKIKGFDLAKEDDMYFDKTSVSEFSALNDVLQAMTDKMTLDYRNLKEFTENASHELQTPLAVIQSKIELLIQSQNLSEELAEHVKVIYESASKLSRLNQALLLLAKIENHQFVESKELQIDEVISKKLDHFEELLLHKRLVLERKLSPLKATMHPILADILLNNLISNAIKHNVEGGRLRVEIGDNKLMVKNSGAPLAVPSETIFNRFKKSNPASDSLGLGLAIVREICNVYGYTIRYDFIDDIHTITVAFR